MRAVALTPGVAGALGVPRPDGRGRRRLIQGRRDITRVDRRKTSPAFASFVSKRVVEAACEDCRAHDRNLAECEESIATVARRFNLRAPHTAGLARAGVVLEKRIDGYYGERWVRTGEYDFSGFDEAPEREQLEEWERAMARTAPIRELVALVRDMPIAGAGEIAGALLERMDEATRAAVNFAVYRYLTAVDLANSVRELLAEATGSIVKLYEERVAAEPLIASPEVV